MKDVIDQLVAEMDEETRRLGSASTLHMIGAPISRYMKGVVGRASKLGLRAMLVHPEVDVDGFCVYDTETTKTAPCVHPWYDLDALKSGEMSCTAEAISLILCQQYGLLRGKHVCVVGRGHAVKGLADFLLMNDCTVTICHSHTKNLRSASAFADILVLAASVSEESPLLSPMQDLIVDASGTRENLAEEIRKCGMTYVSAQDIGRLNISILLNRFVKRS